MFSVVELTAAVEKTRKRQIWNLAAGNFVRALIAFLACFALLLVLGSSWVGWYWPVLLSMTVLLLGWMRIRNLLPDAYSSAQTLDRHLESKDLLSTAFHFARKPETVSRFTEGLITQAESEAARVSPAEAVPISVPRQTWVAGVLLAGIAALLFVRYGIQQNLDLRAPLVQIRFDTLTGAQEVQMARNGKPGMPLPTPESMQVPVTEDGAPESKELSPAPENALETAGVPDVNQAADPNRQNPRQQNAQAASEENDAGDESNPSDSQNGDKDTDSDAPSSPPAPKGQPDAKQQPPKPQESNSLMDKMKDAFANMMNKLNMQPPPGQQNQQQQASKQGQKGGEQKGPGEKGQQSPSKGDAKSEQQADADSNQQGDPAEQAQGNKSSQGDKASDEKSNDQRSGMGKQDGNKDTELAQQMEAMGKISEILGKRADTIKGEMMIEVQNSKHQQLKTPYVNRSAGHKEMGGEINRDEIPLHLHQYIDTYYQQVRKGIPATASAPLQGQQPAPPTPKQ